LHAHIIIHKWRRSPDSFRHKWRRSPDSFRAQIAYVTSRLALGTQSASINGGSSSRTSAAAVSPPSGGDAIHRRGEAKGGGWGVEAHSPMYDQQFGGTPNPGGGGGTPSDATARQAVISFRPALREAAERHASGKGDVWIHLTWSERLAACQVSPKPQTLYSKN